MPITKAKGSSLPEYDSVAELSAATELSNGQLATTRGYYTAGDGGHGTYRYDSASVATVNGGTAINAAGGVGRWLLLHNRSVKARQLGFKADGSTDDSAALAAALVDSTITEIQSNTDIAVSSRVNVTLTSEKRLTGSASIIYTGTTITTNILEISCDTFNLTIEWGQNGNNNAHSGTRIRNLTSQTGTLPVLDIRKGYHRNFYKATSTGSNYLIYVDGSFESVEAHDLRFGSVGRASGTGTPGVSGTNSLFIGPSDATHYPKKVAHYRNTYSGMYSAETGANDVDVDYFACFAPDPTNFPNGDSAFNEYPQVFVESHTNKYYNPIGRAEKHQCVPFVHHIDIYRDGGRTINIASSDINLQWGVGIVENINFYLSSVSGTSPITTNYIPISFYQGATYGEKKGNCIAKHITIFNQIESALTRRLYCVVDLTTGATAQSVDVKNISIDDVVVTNGTVDHVATCSFTTAAVPLRIKNVTASISYSVLGCSTSCTNVSASFVDINNVSGSDITGTSDIGSASSRSFAGKLAGLLNYGIEKNLAVSGQSNNPIPLLLGGRLADGYGGYGGTASVQAANLANDATVTFRVRGNDIGNTFILVKTDFGGAVALLNCTGASAAITSIYETASTFSLGTGSNPDTASRANVWVDSNGKVNIKNRLGSSRTFTVMFIG